MPYNIEPFGLNNRYPICDARNDCTQHFYEQTQHEYLAFWDHDMIPPDNWLDLIGKGDIVSGLTFMWRAAEKNPLHRLQFNQFMINEANQSQSLAPVIRTEPYEVDIVGTACMVIHRRVFDRLGPRPFKEPVGTDGRRAMGEDMAFCREARTAGFKVTIIPSVVFNHVKDVGLLEMWEALCAMSKLSYKSGYDKAVEDIRAGVEQAAESVQAPTLDGQVAQAGGAV
jgi:hypothetical protein